MIFKKLVSKNINFFKVKLFIFYKFSKLHIESV